MPYKDPARQRAYQNKWMSLRRSQWIAENGPCQLCGSTENLQVDHVDPKLKVDHRVWSWSQERRSRELAKCRVLCLECHKKKTVLEQEKGEERSQAKITDEDVRVIRASSETYRTLGIRYGVAFSIIAKIKWRQDWKHVED